MNGTRTATCNEYKGTRNRGGYGILPKAVNGSRLAHRAALAEFVGRPVVGVVRHACDNPPCIEPSHLLEGTHADNVADKVARGRQRGGRFNQTHCKHGHLLVGPNVRMVTRADGYSERLCVPCRREASKRLAARRKAERHKRGLHRGKREI